VRENISVLHRFYCPSGEIPDGFQYDGFVVTGSSASIYWDQDWIQHLKRWVEDAIRVDLPTLGDIGSC
jgi:GMP synthase (glutamine-hydrolysing)